jgi:hypothetical protein
MCDQSRGTFLNEFQLTLRKHNNAVLQLRSRVTELISHLRLLDPIHRSSWNSNLSNFNVTLNSDCIWLLRRNINRTMLPNINGYCTVKSILDVTVTVFTCHVL